VGFGWVSLTLSAHAYVSGDGDLCFWVRLLVWLAHRPCLVFLLVVLVCLFCLCGIVVDD